MAIETYGYRTDLRWVAAQWDGSPESLAEIAEITGQDLEPVGGVITVTLSGGRTQAVKIGGYVGKEFGGPVRVADAYRRAADWQVLS